MAPVDRHFIFFLETTVALIIVFKFQIKYQARATKVTYESSETTGVKQREHKGG